MTHASNSLFLKKQRDGKTMTKNKKILLIGIVAVVIIIALNTIRPVAEKLGDATEKIDRFLGITKGGSTEVFSDEHFFSEKFNKDTADKFTIDLFKFLQFKFQNDNMDSHYSDVLNYLISKYGEEKGNELLELYKKFTNYEMGLSDQKFIKRQPASAAEALEVLGEIKSHRENIFGKELADNLFGEEQRMYEYQIMHNEIVKDPDLYGSEKEKEISALQKNSGYESGEKPEMSEMDQYSLKLRLYKKDLSELNTEQQKELMKKFRYEIFTPDEASRLEQLDLHNEQEARREKGIPDHN